MRDKIYGGIIGLCIGDALGVPVEFQERQWLGKYPVTEMQGYGTHHQPPGTWSDDTSLTLCLLDSLSGGLNYEDIMEKFRSRWYEDIMEKFRSWWEAGAYTQHGEAFDIGNTTREAIMKYSYGAKAIECGGISEYDNGNGSLMRILPLAFFLDYANINKDFEIIHNISSLTHAHERSHIVCGIYLSIAKNLIAGEKIGLAIDHGIAFAQKYYSENDKYSGELRHYQRLSACDFRKTPQAEIASGGYVVDTLEAAVWCLLNTDTFDDCVLKAVNLGRDTDTTAAVAGGLAGIYYGYDSIPPKWLIQITKLDSIKQLCDNMIKS